MEVGILQTMSSLEKSFNSTSRLSLDGIPKNNVLDVKLASPDLYKDQDDEGEIMLLAMILLQLHGVKLPSSGSSSSDDENDVLNKKKRQRTSPDQLAILEQIFQTDKMPNQQTRVHLADQLGMSSRRVQIWFQNKRAKVKRSVSKTDGDCDSSLDQSSSSISPPSSPSSPSLDNESPVPSPSSPAAPLISQAKPLLPLNATISTTTAAPIITPQPVSTTSPAATSIIGATTAQLKAQQLQFSLKAPFVDTQPVLTASY